MHADMDADLGAGVGGGLDADMDSDVGADVERGRGGAEVKQGGRPEKENAVQNERLESENADQNGERENEGGGSVENSICTLLEGKGNAAGHGEAGDGADAERGSGGTEVKQGDYPEKENAVQNERREGENAGQNGERENEGGGSMENRIPALLEGEGNAGERGEGGEGESLKALPDTNNESGSDADMGVREKNGQADTLEVENGEPDNLDAEHATAYIVEVENGEAEALPDSLPETNGTQESGGEEPPTKRAKRKSGQGRGAKGGRRGGKRASGKNVPNGLPAGKKVDEDLVPLQPAPAPEDREMVLSARNKASQIILTPDKLGASGSKGYRMVRATRGVVEGAWYFEVTVVELGATGHTRLGWCTPDGDLQAPVGTDSNSYAYRDLQGCTCHEALRQPYGEAYGEGDTIGFYISLPGGAELGPKNPTLTFYKNQPFYVEQQELGPKQRVPGSEIAFFKNGICQGTAFRDIYAGRYYPAASMFSLPDPNEKASVYFNFGPDFKFPPRDWGGRPVPEPMCNSKAVEPRVDLLEEAKAPSGSPM
eukprot:TRINITY_DN16571_c0_g1_i1.p1 TRINITY_DN16571_c0_g1~~TRINITY_DN16571_c0_g1_i1.p1  ORF type:complete len:543 (+),score=103.07 TRINITY_DN16571_c0_g1_i1:382-2010(+)